MTWHTDYLVMNTKQRYEIADITDDVARIVADAKVREGMVLVSAMHITAGVFVNDDESGLHADIWEWLEKLAPEKPHSQYRYNDTGEDNADAHLKALLLHHETTLPVTGGRLDLGTWQRVFYAEFDGQRSKRVIVKVLGKGKSKE